MTIYDLWYPALAIGFFAAMLAYVRFCAWLGKTDPDAGSTEGTR